MPTSQSIDRDAVAHLMRRARRIRIDAYRAPTALAKNLVALAELYEAQARSPDPATV